MGWRGSEGLQTLPGSKGKCDRRAVFVRIPAFQELPASAVWKRFEMSSRPSVRLHRRRSVRSGSLLGSHSCIQLEKQTQCGSEKSEKRRALMETLNWNTKERDFLRTSPLEVSLHDLELGVIICN
ncbi:hypothetical protein QQF64_020228 [Cirrhinus molitorella]|uniref:Uncharacterized protein n=1 Tax=Cirrhinus molitorella TaxID=172907 RepID=A0ABR3L8S7_9TELE